MSKNFHIAAVLAALFVLGASLAVAQQDQVPIYTPKHTAQPPHTPDALLSISCNLPCSWRLDGVDKGSLRAGVPEKLHVKPGTYEISARTLDGLDHVDKEFTAVDGKQSVEIMDLMTVRTGRLMTAVVDAGLAAAAEEQARKARENKAQQAQDLFDQGQSSSSWGMAQDTCTAGSVVGCRVLGLYYLEGPAGQRDYAHARSLLDKSCQSNDMRACGALGYMDMYDADIPHNYANANLLTAKSCNGGEMRACISQGRLYENGWGVSGDGEKAVEMYKKACSGGILYGCTEAGRALFSGVAGGSNSAAARPYLEKACSGGDNSGCAWLGRLQAESHDYAGAYANYTKACNSNVLFGCVDAGYLLVYGKGVSRDLVRARTLMQRACDGDLPYGCNALGESYALDAQPDPNRALDLFRKTCGESFIYGCLDLGMDYRNGDGTAQDTALAHSQLQKACNSSDSYACDMMKALYQQQSVDIPDTVTTIYTIQCGSWNLLGCEVLINLQLPPPQSYLAAVGEPDMYASAYSVYLASCAADNPRACVAVGEMLDKSLIGYRNKNSVKYYFTRACTEGLRYACARAKQVR